MDNFFINKEETIIEAQNAPEGEYKQIYIEAAQSIRKELYQMKPKDVCKNCPNNNCKLEVKDIFTQYPPNCKLREWQLEILTFLAGDYKQRLKQDYTEMMNKKQNYACSKCGTCCRLAVSEYSYTQLKQRASKGNKFAIDFVSIYEPYENDEDARNVDPEYFDELNKILPDTKIYYYSCKKLKGNLCSDYNHRPDICKNFPNNPLKMLPKSCSYNAWYNEVRHEAQLLKAKVDILNYYKETLQ